MCLVTILENQENSLRAEVIDNNLRTYRFSTPGEEIQFRVIYNSGSQKPMQVDAEITLASDHPHQKEFWLESIVPSFGGLTTWLFHGKGVHLKKQIRTTPDKQRSQPHMLSVFLAEPPTHYKNPYYHCLNALGVHEALSQQRVQRPRRLHEALLTYALKARSKDTAIKSTHQSAGSVALSTSCGMIAQPNATIFRWGSKISTALTDKEAVEYTQHCLFIGEEWHSVPSRLRLQEVLYSPKDVHY